MGKFMHHVLKRHKNNISLGQILSAQERTPDSRPQYPSFALPAVPTATCHLLQPDALRAAALLSLAPHSVRLCSIDSRMLMATPLLSSAKGSSLPTWPLVASRGIPLGFSCTPPAFSLLFSLFRFLSPSESQTLLVVVPPLGGGVSTFIDDTGLFVDERIANLVAADTISISTTAGVSLCIDKCRFLVPPAPSSHPAFPIVYDGCIILSFPAGTLEYR